MAKKESGAFMKPLVPDDTLAKVTGTGAQSRSDVANKLWNYIREKNLQDPLDRRLINSDETLRPIFGGKAKISMFEMTALVSKHLS
ncbi:MAG TPA: SWIB/MDM2 domain-containing protein [Planctomycetota bacterium]|nr:SWIB/MDM2 domain-containing protein [Planctomycetota bacterium]